MSVVFVIAIGVIGVLLFLKKLKRRTIPIVVRQPIRGGPPPEARPASPSSTNHGGVSFENSIPTGYQIFAKNLPVAGLALRKNEAMQFASASQQTLRLEREQTNPSDKNAIKLIGVAGKSNYHLGYLPKELSAQIIGTQLVDSVVPRLMRIYVGTTDFIEIQYQILGPKSAKKSFDAFLQDLPITSEQQDYIRFFKLDTLGKVTTGQASSIIKAHQASLDEAAQLEWEGYSGILSEFGDVEFREGYDLKKVPAGLLHSTLTTLHSQGKSYDYLYTNIDEVVDAVIAANPALERKN